MSGATPLLSRVVAKSVFQPSTGFFSMEKPPFFRDAAVVSC